MGIVTGGTCEVHNCNDVVVAKGLCGKHYKQHQRHGVVGVFESTLINGELASRHPLYPVWRNITRLERGTLVCNAWKDFSTFVMEIAERPKGCQFRRRDASKQYAVDNCYWKPTETSDEYKNDRAEYMRKYQQRKRAANPEYHLSSGLKKLYGITLDEYKVILEAQGGVCAICGKAETRTDHKTKKVSRLHVDHCHESGKVRGLLCHLCNAMLGHAKDDVTVLRKAIAYLGQN